VLLILFGLPGAGKSYAGEMLSADFGFYFHEADDDIPADYRRLVEAGQVVGEDRRDDYHRRLLDRLAELSAAHSRLAVALPLLRDRHRVWLRERFPEAVMILVKCDPARWEARLGARTHTISLEYARKVAGMFEPPTIAHVTLNDSTDGPEAVRRQLSNIVEGAGGGQRVP
jgi:gluconate kinase